MMKFINFLGLGLAKETASMKYCEMATTDAYKIRLQEEQHEHGQGETEGKEKGIKSDEGITESKARRKEALHCAQT
jgi:hypothetical protein